jgi:very-short-patch-repair endonuclease
LNIICLGKKYIEIDGSQHLFPEAIEHNRIRDVWLEKQGWIGRILPVYGLAEYLYK